MWLSTVAAVVVILVTPFAGMLVRPRRPQPRAGRALALASAALPITMFSLMASGTPAQALLGAVVLAAIAGGFSAVGAVATAEQFPGEGRITGLALGATMAHRHLRRADALWLAQLLVERTGWTMAPGAMIAVVALWRAAGLFLAMRETAPLARPQPVSIVLIVRNRIRRSSQGEKYLM